MLLVEIVLDLSEVVKGIISFLFLCFGLLSLFKRLGFLSCLCIFPILFLFLAKQGYNSSIICLLLFFKKRFYFVSALQVGIKCMDDSSFISRFKGVRGQELSDKFSGELVNLLYSL